MPRLRSITPLLPAGPDLASALSFYVDRMGFTVTWQADGMAGIARDDIAFNLVANEDREWADNTSLSIGVSDLDGLYEEYGEVDANVGALEMKAWGRREFHMIVGSGVCFQFYEHASGE